MHANLSVKHTAEGRDRVQEEQPGNPEPGQLVERLEKVFGVNNPDAMRSSVVLHADPDLRDEVVYSTTNARFRLFCFIITDQDVQFLIEPRGRRIRETIGMAWAGIRRAFYDRQLTLTEAALVDTSTEEEFEHGRVG